MKEKETYKEALERHVYDLMYSALELADITDQTVDAHGLIKVQQQFASELIRRVQRAAKDVANELSWIASGDADLSELYPQLYAQKEGGAA